jgi:hypothetical protein
MLSERLLAVDATPDRLITQWMCPFLCEAPPGLPLSYLRIVSNALETALSDRKIFGVAAGSLDGQTKSKR